MKVVSIMEGEFNLNVRCCFRVSVIIYFVGEGACYLHVSAGEGYLLLGAL
jgi:hypothetical protein